MVSVPSCQEIKQDLRKKISRARDQLSEEIQYIKSNSIKDRLLNLPEYINSRTIFCYLSFKSEVKTFDIIRYALKDNKKVCVPVVDELSMSACELVDLKETLKEGAYGILEPKYKKKRPIEDIDLVLLPGLAFDQRGYRLGYGKGYYDRFLKDRFKMVLIGIAYELQIVKRLPVESEDVPVDKIVTEERTIDTEGCEKN